MAAKSNQSPDTEPVWNPLIDKSLWTGTWDFTEFEQEANAKVDAVDRSSNFGGTRTKGNFSVDLKLGQVKTSAGHLFNNCKEPGVVSNMESSPSGSSKRARAANNGSQIVSCLVDGCDSDLSNGRDYHRRHKVCELHSKTPQVLIGSLKRRFCQQCSRFHCLEEFDGGKRSCRKRLDGHNRRRRKPQPDPLSLRGPFLSNYQGVPILPFPSSHIYASATVVNPTWAGLVNTEADARHYNQHHHLNLPDKQNLFVGSPSSSYKAGKQFTFLQGDNTTLNSQASVSQPLLRTVTLSARSGGNHNMFRDRSTTEDIGCALSLLSSPRTQTSGISLSHMLPPGSMPLVQSSGMSLRNNSVEHMESVLVSSGRDAKVHCPGMIHLRSDGYVANDAPQKIPFQWE